MSVATRPWSASHLRSEPARHPHVTVFGAEELNEQIRCTVSDDGVLDKLLRRGQNNGHWSRSSTGHGNPGTSKQ
jgi:hypothetical protein